MEEFPLVGSTDTGLCEVFRKTEPLHRDLKPAQEILKQKCNKMQQQAQSYLRVFICYTEGLKYIFNIVLFTIKVFFFINVLLYFTEQSQNWH